MLNKIGLCFLMLTKTKNGLNFDQCGVFTSGVLSKIVCINHTLKSAHFCSKSAQSCSTQFFEQMVSGGGGL